MALPRTRWGILSVMLPYAPTHLHAAHDPPLHTFVCSVGRLLLSAGFLLHRINALLVDYKQQRLFVPFKPK